MNLKALEQRLMAVARSTAPDEHVPYAFEKRIMAHLAGISPTDVISLWGQALWRAAVPCVTLAMLLSAWSLWQGALTSRTVDFSSEFETAALMSTDQSPDVW
jgi:hypothetical protein